VALQEVFEEVFEAIARSRAAVNPDTGKKASYRNAVLGSGKTKIEPYLIWISDNNSCPCTLKGEGW
jgi:hypothetical protein